MRKYLICSLIMFLLSMGFMAIGQIEVNYINSFWCDNDSFFVKFTNSDYIIPFQVSGKDTTDIGTNGNFNLNAIIYYNKDSIVIPYDNIPTEKIYYIPIKSPKGKTIYRLHFNSVASLFSAEYIKENTGKVQYVIPKIFELANIIWTLSNSGQKANNLYKEGDYYKRVTRYFKPYLNHPIISKLDYPDSLYYQKYFDFRENSFCFDYQQNRIIYNGMYYYVYGKFNNFNNLFKELIPLIQDFANKSNFNNFYSENEKYYNDLIKKQKRLMPAAEMWKWLEKEFPKTKFNSYKIVFSPLIKSSHSTQKYATYHNEWFKESVMFVSGPEIYDFNRELTEKQKEGLLSGILFTEIDHNYVNPTSDKFTKLIDTIFSKREVWVKTDGDTKLYDTPMAVFNEYMTHSLFCLYVTDKYDKKTAEYLIMKRVSLMVDHRHYIKFKEFNQALIKLRMENKNLISSELFSKILDWCKLQN